MKNLKPKISPQKKQEILNKLISENNLNGQKIQTISNDTTNKERPSAISRELSKRVRHDIARIIFLVIFSILIIFGLYFADRETDILSQTAQKITQFLHL